MSCSAVARPVRAGDLARACMCFDIDLMSADIDLMSEYMQARRSRSPDVHRHTDPGVTVSDAREFASN